MTVIPKGMKFFIRHTRYGPETRGSDLRKDKTKNLSNKIKPKTTLVLNSTPEHTSLRKPSTKILHFNSSSPVL